MDRGAKRRPLISKPFEEVFVILAVVFLPFSWWNLCFLEFKVPGVSRWVHFWSPRRLYQLVEDLFPIDAFEPGMGSYWFTILYLSKQMKKYICIVADPLCWVWLEERTDQVFGIDVQILRKFVASTQDLVVDVHWVFIVEGGTPNQHLKEKDPQRPPVHSVVMSLIHDYFRSQVLRGTAQSVCFLLVF